jgi:DNA-binding NarL/FixJ family response regulator
MTTTFAERDATTMTAQTSHDDTIGVFLVGGRDVVREGLTAILGREPDIDVVGEAEAGEDALRRLAELGPAVALVDHLLPETDGLELCREIARRGLPTRVVILSGLIDDRIADEALLAGAKAFVVKDVEAAELPRAIRAVVRGEIFVDPKVAGHPPIRSPRTAPRVPPSELKVLRCLVQGNGVAEIAAATGLSEHTVKTYLRAIYRRLGVSSRAEAVAVALRLGII